MKALTGIAAAEFARRRRQLMRMAGEDAILVLPAAPERVRSHDTHYPYRQDSDFWYLSGFPEPDAVLVLVPGRKHGEAILFCRERDPEREGWDGPRAGQDGAVNDYGMDDAYPIDDLDEIPIRFNYKASPSLDEIENALAAAFSTLSTMTPEEIEAGISFEEAKKTALMAAIQAH